jgi:hypothetical protein
VNRQETFFPLGFCQLGEFDACLQQRIRQFRKLLFDPGDLAAQPAGEGFFHFQVRAAAIEIIDGLSFFIEWDKAARRALAPQFTANELYQSTFVAWLGPRRIAQVRTSRITSVGWSTGDASVSMWLQSPCPVRARTAVLPFHSLFRPWDTHLRTEQPAKVASVSSRAGKFARTPGNDLREMEDSTRCGRAPSSKETVSLQVVRRTFGTTAKINYRTRVTLAGGPCERDFVLAYKLVTPA